MASVHTGNASEQFLHRNRTFITLVQKVPEQLFGTEQKLFGSLGTIAIVIVNAMVEKSGTPAIN